MSNVPGSVWFENETVTALPSSCGPLLLKVASGTTLFTVMLVCAVSDALPGTKPSVCETWAVFPPAVT